MALPTRRVLSDSINDTKVAWYESLLGGGTFSVQNVIAMGSDSLNSLNVTGLDSGRDVDIVTASSDDDGIAGYEHRGPASGNSRWRSETESR